MSEGFIRPPAEVLPDSALVPMKNMISPPPNQFTHEVSSPEPYFYDSDPGLDKSPNGQFDQNAKVVLLTYSGGNDCWVADGRGLHVRITFASLRKL